jgi:hypothetical protein
MKRRDFVISTCTGLAGFSLTANGAVQQKTSQPDLFAPAEKKSFQVFNRGLSSFSDGAKKGVRFSEVSGDGVAYLPDITFANGTIEFDVKGKDVFQKSFVGVAFHGVDGATFDAIYFRPFNFRPEDAARRQRAVQYVAHPT